MIMALSSGFGVEIHFINRNPKFTSIFLSKVNYSEMKDRKSKTFPFNRVQIEDNDNLREYGYGFHVLDQFPIKIGDDIFYISTSTFQ